MTILPLHDEGDAAAAARAVAAHVAGGGIVAYPTETVYGLGCALQPAALGQLARLKGREADMPFLLLDLDPRRLPGLSWTPAALQLAARFWPGPLTLALPADDRYSPPVRSAAGTVAVRDTPFAPLRTLLALVPAPITSTSANRRGEKPARTIGELQNVLRQLAAAEDVLILDGGSLPASAPSTVVDCSCERTRLVREGALPLAELRAALEERGFSIDVG